MKELIIRIAKIALAAVANIPDPLTDDMSDWR